jgi:hypothetical protein
MSDFVRPHYIPVCAWNLMSESDKSEFYKNIKTTSVDEQLKINSKIITQNSINFEENNIKKKFITHYNNELFELTKGYWELCLENTILSNQLRIIKLPKKIYHTYETIPTFNDMLKYKLYVDEQEINTFTGKLLINKFNKPCVYTIQVFFKDYTHVNYKYKFGEHYLYHYFRLSLNTEDTQKYELLNKKKTELESQLFLLNHI